MNSELFTLQELSLNVIIKEFTKYSSVYVTASDRHLIKCLHFLQRIYTPEIFTKLQKMGSLEKQHLDFLLNEYLKELDISVLLNILEKEEVIEKASKIAHSLLELSNYDYSDQNHLVTFKALVPYSPNVNKICVPYFCDDELLKLIATNCFHLTELDVHGSTEVTGVGLSALYESKSKCPLKILNVNDTSAALFDIASLLKNMPTLQEVYHYKLLDALYSNHKEDIDNNAFDQIAKYNLIYLDFMEYLDSSKLVCFLSMCSKLCPYVKKIVVPITKAEELQLCSQFLELEDASIESSEYRPIVELNDFLSERGAYLKKLSINSCSLSMSILISKCPKLEELVLKSIQYQQLDDSISKLLPKLKILQLDSVDFDNELYVDSIVMLLNSSPDLEHLSLFHCDFMDSEIVAKLSTFSLNTGIKYLSFLYSDVSIELLQQIVLNCHALESLSLNNCDNISSEDIDLLKQTIASCNKCIEVMYNNDESDLSALSYSDDYDFHDDDDYDVFDAYDDYYAAEYYGDDYDEDDEEDEFGDAPYF